MPSISGPVVGDLDGLPQTGLRFMENLIKPALFPRLLRQFCLLLVLMLSLIGQARATTYATWIMVWYGHDQAWWNANAPDGLKNPSDDN